MLDPQDIRCPKCGKVCAKWCDGYIEEVKGKKKSRHYQPVVSLFTCECGETFDVPRVLVVKKEGSL